MCPDPWPGPGTITIDLDVCSRALVLLKGEQNIILPCKGSKQHATPYTPQTFPFLSLLDTCAHGILPGEGIAPVQCTTNPYLKVLKLPGLCKDPLDKVEGVGLRSVYAARKASTEALECTVIEVHKLGGVLLDTKATPAPTQGTASIKFASRAVEATTAKPKVLEPWAESAAWCGLKALLWPP